jgi:tetratricopeptide (TPR) repeat protein
VHYQLPEHPRKLGDICWCEGRLDEAKAYYAKAKSAAQFYRAEPDHDRLIKLAFFQEAWPEVVEAFCAASFGRGFLEGQVTIGTSNTTAMPYLEMLACALLHAGAVLPDRARAHLEEAFQIEPKDWDDLLGRVATTATKTTEKLRKRCRPKLGAATPSTVEAACRVGDTARARFVTHYVKNADAALEAAQTLLERFAASGADDALEGFFERVTGSGIDSISRSFLFAALGHDSFPKSPILATRLIRLLSGHPIMNRRHLGTLLDVRFREHSPISGEELLAGVFQNLAADTVLGQKDEQPLAVVSELASVREWARVRLEEWLVGRGEDQTEKVAETWRAGAAAPKEGSPFQIRRRAVESPRDSRQWNELTTAATRWLRVRWKQEIGASPWVSENQLFQLVRRGLKAVEVFQHARPTWLEPQHLDIYVPAVDLAIEFMGRQHFEPLEFFGGEAAHLELVGRDRKKAELCQTHGLELIYVRHDEDLGKRAREVIAHGLSKAMARGLIG